jgi:hypothetical protein
VKARIESFLKMVWLQSAGVAKSQMLWTLRMDVCPVMYKGVCCTGRALNLVGLVVSCIISF